MNFIKSIVEYKNIWLVNKHNNFHIPETKLIIVNFSNGEKQILDINNNRVLRGNYYEIENMKSTKTKVLFEEIEEEF